MRWLLLLAALLSGCGYESPTAPTILPPPVVLEPSPSLPVPDNRLPLQLYFTVGPSDPEEGQKAAFTATIVPAAASYAWDFGDEQIETTETHVTFHSYRRAGEYKPSVTVTVEGQTLTKDRKIVVRKPLPPPPPPSEPEPEPPPANPTMSVDLACTAKPEGELTPCTVNVSYGGKVLPASAVKQIEWEWGDAQTSVTTVPLEAHAYTYTGTYYVFVTVTAQLTPTKTGTETVSQKVVIPVASPSDGL